MLTVAASSSTAGEVVRYTVQDSTEFNIADQFSGVVTTTRPLLRTDNPTRVFAVHATDSSMAQKTAMTLVYVNLLDVNNNQPVFSQVSMWAGTE